MSPGRKWRVERSYLSFCAVRRFDVVHDIDMNIIQDYTLFRHAGSFPENAAKDHTSFRR